MTLQEYAIKVQELLSNHSDQAKVSELLTDLQTDYTELTNKSTDSDKKVETLTKDNENLRSANYKLFSQLGQQSNGNTIYQEINKPTEEKKLDFKDLFDDKGNLK